MSVPGEEEKKFRLRLLAVSELCEIASGLTETLLCTFPDESRFGVAAAQLVRIQAHIKGELYPLVDDSPKPPSEGTSLQPQPA